MFTPRSYREENIEVLHALMQRYNFATLVSCTDSGPVATHIPFILKPGKGPYGTLVAHMARANSHWRGFETHGESLVAFLGPHAYISPSWYARPDSVPTWNYAAVHAYGTPQIVEDPVVLRDQVLQLTALHEADLDPSWDPRHVEHKIPMMLKALVGFEMPINRIEGTFKFNQNKSSEDRAGVVAALEGAADPLVREVAAIMRSSLDQIAS